MPAPGDPFYDIKGYGAVGNGAADDTGAISAAVAAAVAGGGGIVFVPPGNFKVSSSVAVPATVQILGTGYGSKLTQAPGMTTDLLTQATGNGQFICIDNLHLVGNGGPGRAFTGQHLFIGSSIDRLVAEGFGASGAIYLDTCDRVTVGANYIYCANNSGTGFAMSGCLRMRLGQIASERSPNISGGTAISFVACDSLSARQITVEQTTPGTTGGTGIHLDSCIGVWVETVWAYGGGSSGQGDAVRISNTTTAGRTSRYHLGNVTSSGYTNHVSDAASGLVIDAVSTPNGFVAYSDTGMALPRVGGVYSVGSANSPVIAPHGAGTVYVRPGGRAAGAGQSMFQSGLFTVGTQINLAGSATTTAAPGAGGAGQLPAAPAGYVTVKVGGVDRKIAYY